MSYKFISLVRNEEAGGSNPLSSTRFQRFSLRSLTQSVLHDCPTGPVEFRNLANLSKQLTRFFRSVKSLPFASIECCGKQVIEPARFVCWRAPRWRRGAPEETTKIKFETFPILIPNKRSFADDPDRAHRLASRHFVTCHCAGGYLSGWYTLSRSGQGKSYD